MKRDYPCALLLGALAFLACSSEPKRLGTSEHHRNAADDNPQFNAAKEVKLAQSELEGLQVRRRDTKQTIALLGVINDKLCKRLAEYRKDCFVSARLYETSVDKVLGCADNYEEGTKFAPTFEVSAAAPAGKGPFIFQADNSFTTDKFENGTDQSLEWKPIGTSNTLPPRIWELTSVRLKAFRGGTLPAPADTNFEVKVNGNVILNRDSIIPSTDASSTYELKLDRILEMKESDVCSISDKELEGLVEEARTEAAQGGAGVEEDNLGKLPPESALNDTALLEALRKAIDEVKGDLGASLRKYDRENDRNGKLDKELKADREAGCFAKQRIDLMEITIRGVHLDLGSAITEKTKREPTGSPAQLVFRFANGLVKTHSDESTSTVIRPEGGTITIQNDFKHMRVADIEYITVEKGGVGWVTVEKPGRRGRIDYINRESSIYRIDSIQIKVNGETFYFADGINHTLQSGTLKWSDLNITANRAYRELMRRTDCPAQ